MSSQASSEWNWGQLILRWNQVLLVLEEKRIAASETTPISEFHPHFHQWKKYSRWLQYQDVWCVLSVACDFLLMATPVCGTTGSSLQATGDNILHPTLDWKCSVGSCSALALRGPFLVWRYMQGNCVGQTWGFTHGNPDYSRSLCQVIRGEEKIGQILHKSEFYALCSWQWDLAIPRDSGCTKRKCSCRQSLFEALAVRLRLS